MDGSIKRLRTWQMYRRIAKLRDIRAPMQVECAVVYVLVHLDLRGKLAKLAGSRRRGSCRRSQVRMRALAIRITFGER